MLDFVIGGKDAKEKGKAEKPTKRKADANYDKNKRQRSFQSNWPSLFP
jgi:hypothetical protein